MFIAWSIFSILLIPHGFSFISILWQPIIVFRVVASWNREKWKVVKIHEISFQTFECIYIQQHNNIRDGYSYTNIVLTREKIHIILGTFLPWAKPYFLQRRSLDDRKWTHESTVQTKVRLHTYHHCVTMSLKVAWSCVITHCVFTFKWKVAWHSAVTSILRMKWNAQKIFHYLLAQAIFQLKWGTEQWESLLIYQNSILYDASKKEGKELHMAISVASGDKYNGDVLNRKNNNKLQHFHLRYTCQTVHMLKYYL